MEFKHDRHLCAQNRSLANKNIQKTYKLKKKKFPKIPILAARFAFFYFRIFTPEEKIESVFPIQTGSSGSILVMSLV